MEGHGLIWKHCRPCQTMPSNRKLQGRAWHDQECPGKIMEDKVRNTTTFLEALENREAIFGLLHKMIYERYPGHGQGDGKDRVIVSAPSSPQLHTVSGRGLEMLALTGRKEASHSLHEIRMHTISPSVLIAMASLQRARRVELVAGQVSCSTEVEGRALASLLEGCTTWRIERLSMRGQAGGQNWERLGRAAVRGRVRIVGTTAYVVGEAPQSIFGQSSGPWKKDFLDD